MKWWLQSKKAGAAFAAPPPKNNDRQMNRIVTANKSSLVTAGESSNINEKVELLTHS